MTKTYTEAFKKEALHYALSHPEKSTREISKDIDVPYRTLGTWLRGIDRTRPLAAGSTGQTAKALESEVKRLKREVAIQKTELELLKKFNVYLAKNQV